MMSCDWLTQVPAAAGGQPASRAHPDPASCGCLMQTPPFTVSAPRKLFSLVYSMFPLLPSVSSRAISVCGSWSWKLSLCPAEQTSWLPLLCSQCEEKLCVLRARLCRCLPAACCSGCHPALTADVSPGTAAGVSAAGWCSGNTVITT